MCYGCYKDFGEPQVFAPNTGSLAVLASRIDPSGGLHIVIEDWNIESEHIQWCLDNVKDLTADERIFAYEMLKLTMDERATVMALAEGYID